MKLYNHNDEVEVRETVDLTEKTILPADYETTDIDPESYVLDDDSGMGIEDEDGEEAYELAEDDDFADDEEV
jgi:hypothetical protein